MRRIGVFLVAVVAVWIVIRLGGGTSAPGHSRVPPPATTAKAASAGVAPTTASSARFRSRAQLEDHYRKHGAEFGRISIDDYVRRAQALRDAPAGGDVLEVVRTADGVVSRFDRATGAFLAFDTDGTIRTFFKPNDGEAYFRRQAKRRPSP